MKLKPCLREGGGGNPFFSPYLTLKIILQKKDWEPQTDPSDGKGGGEGHAQKIKEN